MLALPAIAAAGSTPWQVGAARVDVTPPRFSSSADALDFPDSAFGTADCPGTRATYTGARPYRFEEPYVDVDSSGEFNYPDPNDPSSIGDQYCDANGNDRWDGIYLSGGIASLARPQSNGDAAHDPIDARAVAISDGTTKVAIVSVVAQGIFENYTNPMRDRAKLECPSLDDVIVSANHNESSPDTIGIYGAPEDPSGTVGLHSGIDDYYMDFLVEKVARAAAQAACDDLQPASLRATQFLLPSNLTVRLSNNFPTTNDDKTPAAIDPKVRVIQAQDAQGTPIFTLMNLAAHNQEIGHDADSHDISSDWPGFFARKLETLLPGMAVFLVGDNGSEEDPKTVPDADTSACGNDGKCAVYTQSQATGEAFAQVVADHVGGATALAPGAISVRRDVFDVPVENHAFQAAFAAGLFGKREAVPCSTPSSATCVHTEVSATRVGPDLQLLGNPGEAFPALMLGSPWGIEEASCPDSDSIDRSNPPVPTWHARSPFRFQIGLSDDMIGYEIPAWGYSTIPGIFSTSCVDDQDDKDQRGHQHKLETEGVGPTGSNEVAQHLTALLDENPDPAASVRRGRYVYADGTLSRRPQRSTGSGTEDAVAVWLADPGSDTLSPGSGRIVALDSVGFFGSRPVDDTGSFMDYDGISQAATPDITTRGMLVRGSGGAVLRRFYLNLYPALSGGPLGAAKPPAGGGGGTTPCKDTTPPASVPRSYSNDPAFSIAGTAHDTGCEPGEGETAHIAGLAGVDVNLAQLENDGSCRFVLADGRLAGRRPCSKPIFNRAEGKRQWSLEFDRALPRGRYRARSRARDADGNVEPADERNIVRFRIR
jgi:hypothetical protein